jgi:hypothetical protein
MQLDAAGVGTASATRAYPGAIVASKALPAPVPSRRGLPFDRYVEPSRPCSLRKATSAERRSVARVHDKVSAESSVRPKTKPSGVGWLRHPCPLVGSTP